MTKEEALRLIKLELDHWDSRFDSSDTIAESIYEQLNPSLTQENCSHPTLVKTGSGQILPDGSGIIFWQCGACGKEETIKYLPRSTRAAVGSPGKP